MLGLAVEGDDGDLGRAGLHDLEILLGDRPVRPVQQQCALRSDLGAHDLHHLRGQLPAGIEGHEAAGLQQPHEAPIAAQKAALIIPDDDLEPKSVLTHQYAPREKLKVAGRFPRHERGPELQPGRATLHAGLRPRPVRGRAVPVPGLRLCGRAVSAPAQSAAALALAGREAGRLPHFVEPAEAGVPGKDVRRGS